MILPLICMGILACKREGAENRVSQELIDEYDRIAGPIEKDQHQWTYERRYNFFDSLAKLPRFQFIEARQRYLFHKGFLLFRMLDYPGTLMHMDSVLKLGNPAETGRGDIDVYVDALYQKGDVLSESGRYRKAYDLFFEAKTFGKYTFENRVVANFYYRMGMAQYRQGEYEQAYSHFNTALMHFKSDSSDFGPFYRIQELMNNKGLCLRKMGKMQEAIAAYDSASMFIDSYKPIFNKKLTELEIAKAVIAGNKADILYQTGNFDAAEPLIIYNIETNIKPGYDNNDAWRAMISLVKWYQERKEFSKADYWIGRLTQSGIDEKNHGIQLPVLQILAKQAYEKGDYKQAADLSQLYQQKADSLRRKSRASETFHVQSYVDALEKKRELAQLEDTNFLQQKLIITFVVLGFIVLVLVLIVAFNLIAMKKKNKQLLTLNEKINRQQEELQVYVGQLEKLGAERERITAIIVHDLRNPLGSIKAMAQLFNKLNLHADDLELVEHIEKASNNALELMNEVMHMTDAKTNKEIELTPTNLSKLLLQTVQGLQHVAKEKSVEITCNAEVNIFAMAHEQKLNRALGNLVSNAIKFSEIGDKVQLFIQAKADKVIIAVQDEGIGIPEKYHADLFTTFTAAKRKGTANEPTFGLGLSIVKEIMDAHQGSVYFESKEGVGTTFYLELASAKHQAVGSKEVLNG